MTTNLLQRQAALIGLFVFTAGLSLAASPDDAFFPVQKGNQWTYKTTNKQKHDTFDMQVAIEEVSADQGMSAAMTVEQGSAVWKNMDGRWKAIMTQKDKRGSMREFLERNEKGIFISQLGLSKALTPEVFTRFNPPVPKVIYPLTPGTKVHWEGRLKVRLIMDKPIIFDGEVTGWEDIEVPAGKFHCIQLHYHEKRGDDVIDEDAWYAEGVGQVKYDGGQFVKELKSYEVSKRVRE